MKRLFFLFTGFLFITSVLPLKAQDLISNSSVTGVCYAGNKVNRIYIPPPDEFYKKSGSKSGGSITFYYSGFSSQAKIAMEYAASILETILPADTKLIILASWEKISTAEILGQSTITGYAVGWGIDALNPNAIYPVALAEKIAGESLNDSMQGDLELTINSSINWYLGIDGNTPIQKYDLVTVVLHEICHGLGFFDSMDTDGTLGWYGFSSIPMIYDTFIENFTEKKLTDTLKFLNYSTALRSQLIGGQLYFNGPLLKKYSVLNNYSGTSAKLWVPSTWDAGSSISHLDEDATLQANSLMTPFIDKGEAIHNPGKYTFSILGDLGWINTRIIHKPLTDTEDHQTKVVLSITIKSDTLYNRNKVGVVFSFDNFLSSNTLFLTSPNSDDSFTTTVSIPSYNTELQYYFYVEDCFLRLYRSPSLYKMLRYQIHIGADTVKPVIIHTPIDYYLETIDSISFKVTAIDNIGINTVYVEYKVNTGPSKFIGLKAGISDSYSTIFSAKSLLLNGGDSILYRIFAIDKALVPNTAILPKSGYFVIHIEDIGSTLQSYSTDFSGAANDFFNIGFDISKPTGFSKYGLHTKHPYESPEDNNKSFDFTALLRHPLKFNESGLLINFNEIVLVEPGEAGSLFGSPDFYDYVIVEGSKNFGKTWFSLADGYDSRYVSTWEIAYNSSIVGQNSTFTGTESMLLKHTIFYRPSDKISAGDTLLLRFRLYSDPYANGWGWVIEDLKINSLVDAVEKISYEPVKVYPNPGNGLIKISFDRADFEISKPLPYKIFNSAGICIKNDHTSGDSETLVDISGYPTGIYIIVLYRDDGIKTIKYSLIK
ncbi:MAG: T9SS type A sorting domain-containing protein [Bacteroidales bacterium]|nr:T9SS type A sorting domain-containing protein [Bacteroidales bacterium]